MCVFHNLKKVVHSVAEAFVVLPPLAFAGVLKLPGFDGELAVRALATTIKGDLELGSQGSSYLERQALESTNLAYAPSPSCVSLSFNAYGLTLLRFRFALGTCRPICSIEMRGKGLRRSLRRYTRAASCSRTCAFSVALLSVKAGKTQVT